MAQFFEKMDKIEDVAAASIPDLCSMIKDLANLQKNIHDGVKEFQKFDSNVDQLIIASGLVDPNDQITLYRGQQKTLKTDLEELSSATKQCKEDVDEYFDYASDLDERTNIVNCKQGLESMGKTFSPAQIDGIGKDIDKLQ